jgi:hypothetical protein
MREQWGQQRLESGRGNGRRVGKGRRRREESWTVMWRQWGSQLRKLSLRVHALALTRDALGLQNDQNRQNMPIGPFSKR